MRIRALVSRTVLVGVVAAASGVLAGTVPAAGSQGRPVSPAAGSQGPPAATAAACATVKVTARPKVNTAMIPETIKSSVTSCAPARETVTLTQKIAGPDVAAAPRARTWTITLSPGQTVVKVRHLPYACCGSYTVTDRVHSASGRQLAKSAAGFTFA